MGAEKLGPRGFHAFLFDSGASDALVDILFRFTLFLGAILLTEDLQTRKRVSRSLNVWLKKGTFAVSLEWVSGTEPLE